MPTEETLLIKDPLVGQVLDSKYELLERLGEGGMGAVYRAHRRHIGDEVAIKILLEKFVTGKEGAERFRREARAAAVLRHPNIVTIHDFSDGSQLDGPAYIVMELVEGSSLRALLKHEGKISPQRAIALMQGVCAGVGAAHRRSIIHRDLKPDNIIIAPPDRPGENEVVKVIDFGIAKLREADSSSTLTQTGTLMGTPFYMSPEQCLGEPLDARSDIYSLGAILYEMLGGVPPFTGTTPTAIIAKHLTDTALPLDQLGVSRSLAEVCRRALTKEPEERYQSVEEFYSGLVNAFATDNRRTEFPDGPLQAAAATPLASAHLPLTQVPGPGVSQNSIATVVAMNKQEPRSQLQSGANDNTVVELAPTRSGSTKQLRRIRNFALAGAPLVFGLSVGLGFLLRWLGWSSSMPYDEFALALITVGLRDSIFGIFLGIALSGLFGSARARAGPSDRVANVIVCAACGAVIVMAPFVLLRTSLMLLPVGLAIIGLLLGATVCGVKMLVQRFASGR
ncbi:MAG: bifunctional serine/threonine protein kinase/MFS transporter [Pyrinomonadaceae bacterium]